MWFKGFLATLATLVLSAPTWADTYLPLPPIEIDCTKHPKLCNVIERHVPEIGSKGSLAAILVVVALVIILYERRRRASPDR